ncbi:MAG: hypothetical protein JST93_02880 [Acidobacteria bacterium]|nr:hypothetical protein [Acidobacteriota bacterium]
MNHQSPLFKGTIASVYSHLLANENTLFAMDNQPKPQGTPLSDACGTVMESHPLEEDAAPRGCVPTTNRPCETTPDKPYSALPAVQSGWVLPPPPQV